MAARHRFSGTDWVARRVYNDPDFLGSILAEYRQAHGFTDDQLAAFLDCDLGAISRLALCRPPRAAPECFRGDVEQVASYVPCSADSLVQVIREVSATRALRASGTEPVRLLAARDRRHPTTDLSETALGAKKDEESDA